MTTYLCNFAKNGRPGGENEAEWTSHFESKKTMILGEGECRMDNPSVLKMTATMLTNKAVGE